MNQVIVMAVKKRNLRIYEKEARRMRKYRSRRKKKRISMLTNVRKRLRKKGENLKISNLVTDRIETIHSMSPVAMKMLMILKIFKRQYI